MRTNIIDNPIIAACDTCTMTLVLEHDHADRTLIRALHHPACHLAAPVADVDRANQ